MDNGLHLDSYHIDIFFSQTRTEMLEILKNASVSIKSMEEENIYVSSKLFSLDVEFKIAISFNDEKLVGIMIRPDEELSGKKLHMRYICIQKELEKNFGFCYNFIKKLINYLDPNNCYLDWCYDNIKIEHYIIERFGMEEIIRFSIV